MSRFCVDTSAYSQFRRNGREVVQLIDHAEWLGVPSIVLGELEAGFQAGQRVESNRSMLAEFLEHPLVEVLDVDHSVGRIYGEIVVALKKQGTPIPTNDVWIAAMAVRYGATVLTFDQHFNVVGRVESLVLSSH